MVLISYHVEATDLTSYPTSLLKSLHLQQQSGHLADISLSSGDKTVSVSSVLLRNCSPLLSSLLQSPCPCSQSNAITLPSTLSSALHSLVSLLYTGYVSNIARDQVEQLMLLTKELGMRISETRRFTLLEDEVEICSACSGYSCADMQGQFWSSSGGHESCGDDLIESDKEEETDKGDIEKNNTSKDSDNVDGDIMKVGIAHKKRRKVLFDDSLQDDELVSMCPPVSPRGSIGAVYIRIEPRDNILSDDMVSDESASGLPVGIEHNVSYGPVSDAADEEKFEVITVRENIVDDDIEIEENVGDPLNRRGDEYVMDFFSEIESDCLNLGELSEDLFEEGSQNSRFFCKICDQAFEKEYGFKSHLASTHYKARLITEFEKFGKVCPICEKKSSDVGKNVRHIGETHRKVYEYYEEDKFSESGDINSNWASKKSKMYDAVNSNVELGGKLEIVKVVEGNPATSIKTPLKGILKLMNSSTKEQQLKSILRHSSLKSPIPPPYQSILKTPKSSIKHEQEVVNRSPEIIKKRDQDRNTRKVILSVQDDVGDTIVDHF